MTKRKEERRNGETSERTKERTNERKKPKQTERIKCTSNELKNEGEKGRREESKK